MRVLRSGLVRFLLFKTFCKLLAKQFYVKLTKVPRDVTTVRAILRKSINVYAFLKSASQHNLDTLRQSRRVLADLAYQEITVVSLYGTGEIAELLHGLASEVSIGIRSIYDDFGEETFLGANVLPIEVCVQSSERIIIASVVGIEEKIAHLKRLGIKQDRIVRLQ